MKDLTQGSVTRQLVAMAVPIAIGMLFQTLYFLVDLYFVSRLGDAAIAGVSSAGTVTFVILALTQMLGIGTVALVSQAVGRKDQAEANLVFNQSVLLSGLCGVFTLVAGFLVGGVYARWLAADPAAAAAGTAYLYWYTPGLALQFALVALGSALRGTGIAKPTMVVQMLTVVLNTVLAPVLISGWGTHHPLGTAGAGYGAEAGSLKGGTGSASYVTKDGITVGAIVAVNCLGSVIVPGTKNFWAGAFEVGNEFGGLGATNARVVGEDWGMTKANPAPRANTTIACIATDVDLNIDQMKRVTMMAQDGLARAIRPIALPPSQTASNRKKRS